MRYARLRWWRRFDHNAWGPWHIIDPASRPSYYSSGAGVCGATLYRGWKADRQEVAELSADDRLCPRCARVAAAVVACPEPSGDGG